MPEGEQPATVIFAIFTDGLENASRRYTWEKIAKKIRRRTEKDGWQFLFLAANQDAVATASRMNIHRANSANVEFNQAGVSSQGSSFSRKASAWRRHSSGLVDADHEDLVSPMADIAAQEHDKKKRSDRRRKAVSK